MILMLYLFSINILLISTYIALNNTYIYISSKIYSGVKNIIFFFMPYKMPQACVNHTFQNLFAVTIELTELIFLHAFHSALIS